MSTDPLVVLLVGHRATGKTTLAKHLHQLDPSIQILDLDEAIEQTHGETCARLVARDEPAFRAIERQTIQALIERAQTHRGTTIIVPGAGCMTLPEGPLCLWLYRDGWEAHAKQERDRLRPTLTWDDEVQWMINAREPIWATRAHLKLHIARGMPQEATCLDAHTLIQWAAQARKGATTQRTYVVPTGAETLQRACEDVTTLGLAGVEIRSDFFDNHSATHLPVKPLLSLRHDDPQWLRHTYDEVAYDIDLAFLPNVLESKILNQLEPSTLLLSHHAPHHSVEFVQELVDAADQVSRRHPDWTPHLVLKYAPGIDTLQTALELLLTTTHQSTPYPLTLLPQGAEYAWTRPWLMAQGNVTNYIPVGLTEPGAPTPYDYQAWLPHLVGQTPTRFDALIGQPVSQSIGDLWHRRAALHAQHPEQSYLKIPVPRDIELTSWEHLLETLHQLGLRGLSVTSPFKRLVPQARDMLNRNNLDAANTIALGEPHQCTDTDAMGLRATLTHIQQLGITPGTVAMIGHGGVSPAMVRAIEQSDWTLIHHARARQGWTKDAPASVDLIINASGDSDTAYIEPPDHAIWLDLHYTNARAPLTDALHLNGRHFFDAQAKAQRHFWLDASTTNTEHT